MTNKMRAIKLVALIALLVGSLVNVWVTHRRIEQSRQMRAVYERDSELRNSLIRSGETCVTWDSRNLIQQHWRPVIHRIGWEEIPNCEDGAPAGVKKNAIGLLVRR